MKKKKKGVSIQKVFRNLNPAMDPTPAEKEQYAMATFSKRGKNSARA